MEVSLIVQILLMGLLLTFLWLQLIRIAEWMIQRLMEWERKEGEKRRLLRLLRLLRRLLLDPL
jgi:hypothetical protein